MTQDKQLFNDDKIGLDAARQMENLAKKYCSSKQFKESVMKNKLNACDCQWYHVAWGYCRFLNLIPSPDIHAEYFQQFFHRNWNRKEINVLISGTADFTILDHIICNLPSNLYDKVKFTVLDLCLTPLKICDWYHEKRVQLGEKKLNIVCVQGDAKHINLSSEKFDLITTYSFLSRFDGESQREIVAEWYRMLKVGGEIITSDRITAEYASGFFQTAKIQQDRFIERAEERLSVVSDLKEDKKIEILELIKNYICNIESFSFPTTSSFCSLFDKFICDMDVKEVPGESDPTETYIILRALKI